MSVTARTLPTLDDLEEQGQRVLVRVDFNVPLADGEVADDSRIAAALPTLLELIDRGCSLVLMSHLGRPHGVEEDLRMAPVGAKLSEHLGRTVWTLTDTVGAGVEAATSGLASGEVMLLENLRFDSREKANDAGFASELARLAQVYVNDAFGTAHREAASTVGVARQLPAYAGRLMAEEITVLSQVRDEPARPFMVVLGGAKISDKIGVIESLLPRAAAILVGGGMANTLLAARGVEMGASLVEEERLDDAKRIAGAAGEKLHMPTDLVVAEDATQEADHRTVTTEEGVPDGWLALDIGPQSVETFAATLAEAKTVVWNGPMGVFELATYAEGTFELARAIAGLKDAMTVVGGGDSGAAVRAAGVEDEMSFVSTGGGAALQLLEGRPLPAVEVLLDRHQR